MDQWSIESLKDRARKFADDARNLSADFQYALRRREKPEEDDMKKKALTVLAIVAAVVAFCGLAYGVFRLLSPDYLGEYDDYDEDAEDSEE